MSDLFTQSSGAYEVKPPNQSEPKGSLDVADLSQFDRLLIDAYVVTGRTLDDLPYTAEFEDLYMSLGGEGCGKSRRELFHRLHNLRKASKLPRIGRTPFNPPAINLDDEELLSSLVVAQIGTLGQRDQLPFTPRFDLLAQQFNDRTGRSLKSHDVWRLVAKLAK
jgi:hypothetical protein